MRRITLMAVSTLAAIVMLFSYRTSTRGSTAEAASIAQPPGIVTAATPTTTRSGTQSAKSAKPTAKPTTKPTTKPTAKPTTKPTTKPTAKPTTEPTAKPTTPVATPTSVTINGSTSQTRYGPVQVQVTISDKKIISVTALQHPSGNGSSDQINARALPQLAAEVLTAQSAHVNTISGATYTSEGYISSLQSALDTGHFA